jgi:hypothetical protein
MPIWSITTMHQCSFRHAVVSAAVVALCAPAVIAQDRDHDTRLGPDDLWTVRIDRSKPAPLALNQERPDETENRADSQVDRSSVIESEDGMIEPEPSLWKGFLTGDRHFRDKPRPMGAPWYFEDPFINSDLRPFFTWHKFPRSGALGGGQLTVYAMQVRLALSERLQFIATADGFSHLESPILHDDTGANDLAIGLKYALIVDHENDFLLSTGLRWRLSNGHARTLNGNVDELSPFITLYQGIGKWNFIADVVGRIAMDEHQGNHILSWDAHVDYELFENFFPLLEIHGLHYLSNGDRLPWDIGGADYANIGSNDVAGTAAFWGSVGFRWNLAEHVSWGAAYEFPLQDPQNNDIFEQRAISGLTITY